MAKSVFTKKSTRTKTYSLKIPADLDDRKNNVEKIMQEKDPDIRLDTNTFLVEEFEKIVTLAEKILRIVTLKI